MLKMGIKAYQYRNSLLDTMKFLFLSLSSLAFYGVHALTITNPGGPIQTINPGGPIQTINPGGPIQRVSHCSLGSYHIFLQVT